MNQESLTEAQLHKLVDNLVIVAAEVKRNSKHDCIDELPVNNLAGIIMQAILSGDFCKHVENGYMPFHWGKEMSKKIDILSQQLSSAQNRIHQLEEELSNWKKTIPSGTIADPIEGYY